MNLVIGTEQTLFQGTNSLTFVPLRDVRVKAKIVDVVAKMTVQQTYYNEEPNPIEVIYVFPLDNGAAVCEFSIHIDGHLVHGASQDTVAAREMYNSAISEGHWAFLLEQLTLGVFQISVGNLAPREQADVTIAYLKLSDGNVDKDEFPIPTWFPPCPRQSTPASSFLATAERPDGAKRFGPMITKTVRIAPVSGDYFHLGATVGAKVGKSGSQEVENEEQEGEEEEKEHQEPVAAAVDNELSLEQERPDALKILSRDAVIMSTIQVTTSGKAPAKAEGFWTSQETLERDVNKAVEEALDKVKEGRSPIDAAGGLAQDIGSATEAAVLKALEQGNVEGQGDASGLAQAKAMIIALNVSDAINNALSRLVGDDLHAKGIGEVEVSERRLALQIVNATKKDSTMGGAAASNRTVAEAVVDVLEEVLFRSLHEIAENIADVDARVDARR